ncbi:MAG: ribbon-helix-helix domain-containing protein [Acidimicrobiales bacterium]
MSVPITTRLDAGTVEALDRAVRAGAAPSRAAVVAQAVQEWLARHSEEAITASYRRAYAEADPEHDELVARLGAYSATVTATER